jgi:hypothetical protein
MSPQHSDEPPDHPPAVPQRPVKSFRLRADLTHQIEILAAQQRRKLYELVEEALEDYLARSRSASP